MWFRVLACRLCASNGLLYDDTALHEHSLEHITALGLDFLDSEALMVACVES